MLSPPAVGEIRFHAGERALKAHYGVSALDGFGAFTRAEVSASRRADRLSRPDAEGKIPALAHPSRMTQNAYMSIVRGDAAQSGIDAHAGGRNQRQPAGGDPTAPSPPPVLCELAARLAAPLTDVVAIAARHDAVAFFAADGRIAPAPARGLRRAPDVARALARLSVGRGGPRDLGALRDGIQCARAIRDGLRIDDPLKPSPGEAKEAWHQLSQAIADASRLSNRLDFLLVAEPPFFARDGGFVTANAHSPLDEARALRVKAGASSRAWRRATAPSRARR